MTTKKHKHTVKKVMALLLCLCMLLPIGAGFALAMEPEDTGLCEHHPEHTEECGYREAAEEAPCQHVHDQTCGYMEEKLEVPCDKECVDTDGDGLIDHAEDCAYQPAVEGQPCTHQHDEACGYAEAVEGQPCTFMCQVCNGKNDETDVDKVREIEALIITPGLNNVGFPGVTYDLLEGIKISPETDGKGNSIQVRIASITSTDQAYQWDGQTTTLTPAAAGVVYTVTYEAYSEAEGEEIILATKDFALTIRGDSEIGKMLDGDYAYISEAGLLADPTTESRLAVRTGSAPWDEENEKGTPGNDTTDLDNTVRSFDIISYTAFFKSKVRENAPYVAYQTGTLHFEFVLPGNEEQVRYETGSMGWLDAKKDVWYEITEESYDGQTCQVLRGSYLWEPSDQNPAAIGESYQELTLVVRALALKNGDTITPEFTFWLEHNDVPENGLVTGSNHTCSEHNDIEYKTITAPVIQVTAAPRYNVRVKYNPNPEYLDTFDFSTGNDMALNKGDYSFYGRANVVGVTLQISGKSPEQGLRGCEIPDGSDITFDLTLSSSYRGTDGQTHDVTDTYEPLVWSLEGNNPAATQQDGREIHGTFHTAPYTAPINKYDSLRSQSSCKNGGMWNGKQEGHTLHLTVSGYEIDLTQLPWTNCFQSSSDHVYYNPGEITNYWEIQNACFSAGEVWIAQPFYKADDTYVVDEYGTGTFTISVTDGKLRMKGLSGQMLPEAENNANQMVHDDDTATTAYALEKPGTIDQRVTYMKYTNGITSGNPNSLTVGCYENGKDWITSGGKLNIQEQIDSIGEMLNTWVAYDALVKFDDAFFSLDATDNIVRYYQEEQQNNFSDTYLYGAKPDKSGWNHKGLNPEDAGYDTEMMQATADDLIFFSSLDELKQQGYTCVAVLGEARGVPSTSRLVWSFALRGTARPDTSADSVYMVTHCARVWNKRDVQAAAAKYLNKAAKELTDADYKAYVQSDAFPSRANKTETMSYADDYLKSTWVNDYNTRDGLRTYEKVSYDENGYKGGSAGTWYGDSCLVVGYATKITKNPSQKSSAGEKLSYDMDVNQRIVDYELHPSAVRTAGESSTEGTEIVTDLYIEDTLPKGLAYIPMSSYLGGTYRQTGEGKQGVIEDGIPLQPEIISHADGTTTLRWRLEQVTVTGEEVTNFDTIYYSCDIGRLGDEANDVTNNEQLLNTAKIWSSKEQKRDFTVVNGNYADQSILVSKNNAVSLSKTADQAVVDVGDGMPFTLNIGNNAANPLQVVALDSLPYADDPAGSNFDGVCRVTELTVNESSRELLEGNGGTFKLYYTTAESERGKSSVDYEADAFSDTSVWTELPVDAATGKVTLPDDFAPLAVAAVGTLPAQKTLKMHITCLLPEGKPGDYIANRLTRGDLESYARSYIVSRTLEGVVWLDEDMNGLRGGSETMVDGVTATLMKLKEGGDASNLADYEAYIMANDQTADVQTGQQMDLSGGAVTDYGNGKYKFTNLPAGTFGVLFSDGTFKLEDYVTSPENLGSDDTLDSDALPDYIDGKLNQAFIPDIFMPVKEQITARVYTSRHHDMGLYVSQISIPVEKVWDDSNNQDGKRPNDVIVTLYADGVSTGKTLMLNQGNGWKDSFEGLPESENGARISYTVEETPINGYEPEITGDPSEGFTITNTHIPETITLSGAKTWNDANDQDGKRPDSITIRIYADGTELTDKALTVTADNNWQWSFTDLPKYADGEEIAYTLSEDKVDGYTPAYTDYNITNTYTPEQTSITVTKAWADNNDQDGIRTESITVKLLANEKDTGKTLTLSKENHWTGTFSGLDEYAGGKKIAYTIEEVTMDGYNSVITGDIATGFTITNSHTPETITLSGAKTWDDADNQDGKRPDSITIRLYADGEQAEVVIVTAEDDWTWAFENLPKYAIGSEIHYTITEDVISDYQSEIDGMDVTNRYTPGRINIPVTKNWQDQDDADGIRPDSITVKLYADGEDTGRELVLEQKNNWTGSFNDLDEYADGVKIVYTIAEVKVDGYDTVISGSTETGFVISNSHTPIIPDIPTDPNGPQDPGQPGKPELPKGDAPKTGDTTNPALWLALLAISGTGLTAALVFWRKKRSCGKYMK